MKGGLSYRLRENGPVSYREKRIREKGSTWTVLLIECEGGANLESLTHKESAAPQ
jgi:hypothetical protein